MNEIIKTVDDQKLARQIRDQYDAAVGGMVSFIGLGALGLHVRELVGGVSACGHSSVSKGGGVKGWLEKHDLGYTRQTLYRAMEIAESIRDEFKIGPRMNFVNVLIGDKPSPAELLKRKAITGFVAGKSQRQILLQVGKPDAEVGGKRTKVKKLTPEQEQAEWIEAATQTAKTTVSSLCTLEERWKLLDDVELKLAVQAAEAFVADAKSWLQTPQPSRAGIDAKKYLEAQEDKQS